MTQIGLPAGWQETIGNLTIIGRPLSRFSITRTYDKTAVKNQLTFAVNCARQMVIQTRELVVKHHRAALALGRLGAAKVIPMVEALAHTHFKMPASIDRTNYTDWVELFAYLDGIYMMIGQGISGTLTLVDVDFFDRRDGIRGCVNFQNERVDPRVAPGLLIADRGRIHINFEWVTTRAPQRVARTIIHEGAHRFVGADDPAYKWEAKYATLTPAQARVNADSIACFAYYLCKSGVYALS